MRKDKNNKGSKTGNRFRTYWKGVVNFKCSNDDCGIDWWTVHDWNDGKAGMTCEFCNKYAKIVNAVDEYMDIAVYTCTAGANCGNQWKSIPDEMSQECDVCGTMVPPGGTQRLFGRHFFFACKFKECSAEVKEWEDFSLMSQPTQRCTKCKSRGDIVCFKKHVPKSVVQRRKKMENGGGDRASYKWGRKYEVGLCDIYYQI